MAKEIYFGVGNVAKRVRDAYVGIGGVARRIKKGYIGIGGVARLFYEFHPTIEQSTASSTMSYRYYRNQRGTVFNNQALITVRPYGGSSTPCIINRINTSLSVNSISVSTAYVSASQMARLSSYAIAGGTYGYSYEENKISINSSFTASSLSLGASDLIAGTASETSSYAVFMNVGYVYTDSDDNEHLYKSNKTLYINNSLTSAFKSNTYPGAGGLSEGSRQVACTFGDLIIYADIDRHVCTFNNSLTFSSYSNKLTDQAFPYTMTMGRVGKWMLIQYPAYPTIGQNQYCVDAIDSSLTLRNVVLETQAASGSNSVSSVQACESPNAVVFAGGVGSANNKYPTTRVMILDETLTDITGDAILPTRAYAMLSPVHPLGSMAILAGGNSGTSTNSNALNTINVFKEV